MPRTPKTRCEREADISAAASALGALVARASAIEAKEGSTADATRRAWESVEANGAIVHRQARLMAGKARGG